MLLRFYIEFSVSLFDFFKVALFTSAKSSFSFDCSCMPVTYEFLGSCTFIGRNDNFLRALEAFYFQLYCYLGVF